MRRLLAPGACVALLLALRPAGAAETPAAAREHSSIKPAGERQIGQHARPTLKSKSDVKARSERGMRISMQIPDKLRLSLQNKIDARISRNIVQAKQLRREAVELLQKFLREAPPDTPDMAMALVRLGELEWEGARDRFVLQFRRWENQPDETRGEPPVPDYSVARALFLRVLKNYKEFGEYDLALYIDGFLANEEGKFAEAKGRFDKILDWFPKSRFVPDAHMLRAEYEFTKDVPDYAVALREYEQVLRFKKSDLYDLALFKSAWTMWRLGRREEAARRFLAVFKNTEKVGPDVRRADLEELQAEALKNLVGVFVEDEQNTADDMHKFLVDAGGDKFASKIVRALAEAFYDQAHYERGIEAYRLLIKLAPMSPNAYQHELAIARAHSTLEAWVKLEQDYRRLIQGYVRPKGKQQASAWVRAQSPDVVKRSEGAIERQLRDDAVGLHAKAQRDKGSQAEFAAAAKLYDVYLSRFDDGAQAFDAYFNRAEIRFYHLGDYPGGADDYLHAVRLKPKHRLVHDALANALSALERARATEFEQQKAQGKKQQETPTDKKLTEAMELFVASFPNDPNAPELLFRQGKLYYDYQVYDVAVRQWGLLLEKYPKSPFATGAGELLLDSFNKSEDYANIETWARRLKSAPSFAEPAQQAKLNTLIVQAVFKQGEQLSQKGEHAKAAKAYLRAATEFPREARAAQAAVNAEIEARRAADFATLGAAAALLVKNHSSRPEAAQGVWIAAEAHQSVGLLSEAANYHASIVDNWPRYEKHRDAAYNAVLLRTTVGEHSKAIQSGNKFRQLYPRDAAADEVIFLMGKAHEKAEKWKDAAQLYERYAQTAKSAGSQIEALVRLAGIRARLGDEAGASAALDRALKVNEAHKGQLDASGKYFAAKGRYMQGERVLKAFDAVKIEGDVKQLKQRLKKKGELLKKAADTFLATAEMGVAEWTTASLYQIGFTYESFTKALLNSPPPASLNEADKELYKQSIEEFVIPIEERALEAYESGWKKAVELNIFNSWTAKMRAALGRLNSELYAPMNEVGFALRSKGASVLPPLIDGPRRSSEGKSETFYLTTESEPKRKTAAADAKKPAKPETVAPKGKP